MGLLSKNCCTLEELASEFLDRYEIEYAMACRNFDTTPTTSGMKRLVHWEALKIVCDNRDLDPILSFDILNTFRSPRKWELLNDCIGDDSCFTAPARCTYSGFGTLYMDEAGVYFDNFNNQRFYFHSRGSDKEGVWINI